MFVKENLDRKKNLLPVTAKSELAARLLNIKKNQEESFRKIFAGRQLPLNSIFKPKLIIAI